jgi:cob(I)alamin adenosyltransferase
MKRRIYTRGGDEGETGLLGGSRVPKDDPRVAACGDVDELGASLGTARAFARNAALDSLLQAIQADLVRLGTRLADPRRRAKPFRAAGRARDFERLIDRCETRQPPLRAFVLPGGPPSAAFLHVARTVCRRAERSVVALARSAPIERDAHIYLNRLSDLLFVLARTEARPPRAGGRRDGNRRLVRRS